MKLISIEQLLLAFDSIFNNIISLKSLNVISISMVFGIIIIWIVFICNIFNIINKPHLIQQRIDIRYKIKWVRQYQPYYYRMLTIICIIICVLSLLISVRIDSITDSLIDDTQLIFEKNFSDVSGITREEVRELTNKRPIFYRKIKDRIFKID